MLCLALDGFPLVERCRRFYPIRLARRFEANPTRALSRLDRAIAGSLDFLRPLRQHAPRAAAPAAPSPTRAERAPTPYDPAVADRNRMLRAFQTQSIGQITRRLCHAIGIDKSHDDWPEYLLTLRETPADCATRLHGARPYTAKPTAAYWTRLLKLKRQAEASQVPDPQPEPTPEPHPRK